MKLEQQVSSLGLSKRLKELGITQNGYFNWSTDNNGKFFVDSEETYPIDAHYPRPEPLFSAFTASELLELLPRMIMAREYSNFLKIFKSVDEDFIVGYYSYHLEMVLHAFFDKNICNSLAKMLIYLIENNLLE